MPGQVSRLAEALAAKATYHMFKASDGVEEYCSTSVHLSRDPGLRQHGKSRVIRRNSSAVAFAIQL